MLNNRYLPWFVLGAVTLVIGLALSGMSVPWVYIVIALACPVMMLFMMGGMDSGGSTGTTDSHRTGSGSNSPRGMFDRRQR